MESINKTSSDRNSEHLTEDQNNASQNTQGQALLRALQEFVIPLIRGAAGQQSGDDINPIPLGPAEKFITALKEFISSIVDSQPAVGNATQMGLSEEDIKFHATLSEKQGITGHTQITEGKSKRVSQEKVFKRLREHVFNQMPIRLLCFEHLGAGLQISLVERNSIYARIEATMRSQMNEADLLPRITGFGNNRQVEADDEVIQRLMSKYAQYAILSHTWLRTAPGEVTYGDWNKGQLDANDAGYRKLVNFCKTAWRDYGVAFGWMDTVCINKDSSSELDESIRSMYNWYQQASVCIIYLAETETFFDIHLDPWFTRGWTLQELLAPRVLKFYNADWKKFSGDSKDDKNNTQIMDQIEQATTISVDELTPTFIRFGPISRKMQLAAQRQVTREEDTAYSLMGIFNVSFAIAYGEGASRAFSRLLQELLATTKLGVLDIFNWAGPYNYVASHNSFVLPSRIDYYNHRSTPASEIMQTVLPMEPITLTHLGLRVPVILMRGISVLSPASKYDPIGDYHATVDISPVDPWDSCLCATYQLLHKNVSGPDGRRIKDNRLHITFAVLSFSRATTANTIRISKTCFALALRCPEDVGKVSASSVINVVETDTPIVFNLDKKSITGDIDTDEPRQYYRVKTDELPKHGMQFVTLYL